MEAAQGVDDLRIRSRKQVNDDDDDEEEVAEESEEKFEKRVHLYAVLMLQRASGSKRDNYKDSLVYQTRKDLIVDFLKSAIVKKCQNANCSA